MPDLVQHIPALLTDDLIVLEDLGFLLEVIQLLGNEPLDHLLVLFFPVT